MSAYTNFNAVIEEAVSNYVVPVIVNRINDEYRLDLTTDEIIKCLKMSEPKKPAVSASRSTRSKRKTASSSDESDIDKLEEDNRDLAKGTCLYIRGEKVCEAEIPDGRIFCDDHRRFTVKTLKKNIDKKIRPMVEDGEPPKPASTSRRRGRNKEEKKRPTTEDTSIVSGEKLEASIKASRSASQSNDDFVYSKTNDMYISNSLHLAGYKSGKTIIVSNQYDAMNDKILPLTGDDIQVAQDSGYKVDQKAAKSAIEDDDNYLEDDGEDEE